MEAFANYMRRSSASPRDESAQATRPSSLPAAASSPQKLPSGPCNYRHLNGGNGSPGCGCRQFWSVVDEPGVHSNDNGARSGSEDRSGRATCYCGHHACFHDAYPAASLTSAVPSGPETRARTPYMAPDQQHYSSGNGPLLGTQAAAFDNPLGLHDMQTYFAPGNLDMPFGYDSFQHSTHELHADSFTKLNSQQPPQQSSGLGLHTVWPTNQMPPPSFFLSNLPKQHHSNLPSTQSSAAPSEVNSVTPYPRQSPSRKFFEHVLDSRRSQPAVEEQPQQMDYTESVTEVATPSQSGTPGPATLDAAFENARESLERITQGPSEGVESQRQGSLLTHESVERLLTEIGSLRTTLLKSDHFRSSLLTLSNRIDALESASFSYMPTEELEQRLDAFDGRIVNLQCKVDDVERAYQGYDQKQSFSRQFDTHASSLDVEAMGRLYELEHRLIHLETETLPTLSRPWEVELVFLPWGRSLHGLWFNPLEVSRFSQGMMTDSLALGTYEGTATTQSGALEHQHKRQHRETANPPLLVPRAVGPTAGSGGKAYNRLKSRGLVRTIDITTNGATEIQSQLAAVFADLLNAVDYPVHMRWSSLSAERLPSASLRLPLLPLRKVHRSAQLRFLSQNELSDPTSWTADFLNASVFMKRLSEGQRRFYVTVADGYLQHEEGCTWQQLRELPVKQPDPGLLDNDANQASALDDCWSWDSRLDVPISISSSVSSHPPIIAGKDVVEATKSTLLNTSFTSSHPLSPRPSTVHSNDDESDLDRDFSDGGFGQDSSDSEDELAIDSAPITPTSESAPLPRNLSSGSDSRIRRTVSLPIDTVQTIAESSSKRHAASFEITGTGDLANWAPTAASTSKRRRLSKTPDALIAETEWAPTPRRSHEPPSPRYAYAASSTTAAPKGMGTSKRGLTPMEYATPYSHSIHPAANARRVNQGADSPTSEGHAGDKSAESDESGSDYESDSAEEGDDDDAMAEADSEASDDDDELMSISVSEDPDHNSAHEQHPEADDDEEEDDGEQPWEGVHDVPEAYSSDIEAEHSSPHARASVARHEYQDAQPRSFVEDQPSSSSLDGHQHSDEQEDDDDDEDDVSL